MNINQANGDLDVALNKAQKALIDESFWPKALDAIAQYLGARFAVLVFEDSASALLELKHSTAAEKQWISEFLRHHRRLDAVWARSAGRPAAGLVLASGDILSKEQFRRSGIFQRWLAPHQLSDIAGVVVSRSESGACLLIACFDADFCSDFRNRLATLSLHLSQIVEGAPPRENSALLIELFDMLAAPVIVIDRYMRVRYRNRVASASLEAEGPIGMAGDMLVVHDRLARDALVEALAHHPSEPGRLAIMLRHEDSRCCVMHVLPLAGRAAALILRQLSSHPSSGGDLAAKLYGLTARESSVLLAIAEVGGVPATAQALALSEGTVKSYLKSIFQKTGARRQADLVRLALLLESPFAAPALIEESVDPS